MQLKNARDFWAGALFVGAGLAAVWQAIDGGVGSLAQPGPGLLPLGLGATLALLGALLLFKALTIEAEAGAPAGPGSLRALASVALAMAGGALLLDAAGAGAGLVAAGLGTAFGWRGLGWRRALLAGLTGALAAAVAGAVILGWGLGRSLPWWPGAAPW